MKEIFKYELRHWLCSPIFHLLWLSFFAISFVSTVGTGGGIDGEITTTEQVLYLNSSYSITFIGLVLTKMLLFIIPILVGNSIYRDFKSKTFSILYAYPIKKYDYIIGKLGSAITLVLATVFCTILGLLLGMYWLGDDNSQITTFNITSYIISYGIYAIPTLFVCCALTFAVVGLTRNIFTGFVVVLCFFLLQLIIPNALTKFPTAVSILEPFGQYAFQHATSDWNIQDKNTYLFPIDNMVLVNRMFWIIIASLFFYYFIQKFDLNHQAPIARRQRVSSTPETITPVGLEDLHVITSQSLIGRLISIYLLSRYYIQQIVTNWMFVVLALVSVAAVFFIQLKATTTGDLILHPYTRILLSSPLKIFTLLVIIITILFSGILVHRDRTYSMHELVDSSASQCWQFYLSKFLALFVIQCLLLFLFLLTSICIQLLNEHTNLDLPQYCFQLFVLTLPFLCFWSIFSLLIFTLFSNFFIGLFVSFLALFGTEQFDQIGLTSLIFKLNQPVQLTYSDFNGYGQQLSGYLIVMTYWAAIALILLLLAITIWRRGYHDRFIDRMRPSIVNISPKALVLLTLTALTACFIGSQIRSAEVKDNLSSAATAMQKGYLQNFKLEWNQFVNLRTPQIAQIDLKIDLDADNHRLDVNGEYHLVNTSYQSIDTLLIHTGFDEKTTLMWESDVDTLKMDVAMKYFIIKFNSSWQPFDTIKLRFRISNETNTLFTRNTNVIRNGTFLSHDMLPRFNYPFESVQTVENQQTTRTTNYFSRDAHVVHLRSVISTEDDQIVLAPGEKVSTIKYGNKTEHHFRTRQPIKFNFSFHAADYDVTTNRSDSTEIQAYFHPEHPENVPDMVQGIGQALQFNSILFGPYPHNTIRLIEFPHTEGPYTATLTANNIPTSELLFTVNNEDMDEINLPFYVTAHELTHEWFGNQVMPAESIGSRMLTESITEYLTLQIYRQTFGKERALNFLNMQHRRYFAGQKKERKTQPSLIYVEPDQEYISYGKGAVVFNAIGTLITHDSLQQVLKTFLSHYHISKQVYPTPYAFVNLLRSRTEVALHPIIHEFFDSVITHDFSIKRIDLVEKDKFNIRIEHTLFDLNETVESNDLTYPIILTEVDKNGIPVRQQSTYISGLQTETLIHKHEAAVEIILDRDLLYLDRDRTNNTASF